VICGVNLFITAKEVRIILAVSEVYVILTAGTELVFSSTNSKNKAFKQVSTC